MSVELQVQRERSWIEAIRRGEERSFEEAFHFYHAVLVSYAASLVGSRDAAREVVQDVFLTIWEHRAVLEIRVGLRPYLYRAVRNRCLDHMKRRRRLVELGADGSDGMTLDDVEDGLAYRELLAAYHRAVAKLPERRRTAFVLHREHGLSCAEIALVMMISERTVETQIGKALRALRASMADLL